MRDGLAEDEGGDQVLDRARLATVRPEHEGVETPAVMRIWLFPVRGELGLPFSPEVVESCDVRVHVVDIVAVRRVVHLCPLLRGRDVRVKHRVLRLGLVIHRVEPNDVLQETVELRVRGGVDGDFKQRPEQIIF